MNWSLIVWIIHVIILDGLRYKMMDRTNLIQINSELSNMERATNVENSFTYSIVQQMEKINMTTNKSIIWYDRATLYSLADKVRRDPRYKVFNHKTCNNIREHKLNRRGCRGGIRRKSHLDIIHQTGSNKNNLIRINTEQQEVISNYHSLCICLANIQSVKNKQLILHQYLVENKINLCILTETWLRNTEADQAWLQCSMINNSGFKCFTSNRQDRRGGGLALICRNMYRVVPLGSGQLRLRSFQFAKWRIVLKHTTITILAIYHPPYSNQTKATNHDFLDEFTNWVAEYIMNNTNVIILGDFNLHVNDPRDDNAMNFIESTQALALQQHVNFSTHISGNTLDLVFTELFNELKIQKCTQDDFISDHCIVKCNLNVNRPDIIRKVISYHKLKDINIQNMINSVTVTYIDNLDGLVEQFDKALSKALDDVAPIQTKQQTVRKSIPWFTDEVKEHK